MVIRYPKKIKKIRIAYDHLKVSSIFSGEDRSAIILFIHVCYE